MQRCSSFSRWTDPRCNADEQSFIFAPKFRAEVAQDAGRIGYSIIRRVLSSLVAYAAANPPRGRCAKTESFSILSS
jgi:hypothetical protein